jgi:adenylate cyclase
MTGRDESHIEHRLAAILAADLVGYSRLMAADESGTLFRLKAHLAELVEPAIAAHRGRLFKTTGDGLLVQFGSAIDALRCALDWQRGMARRETDLPAGHRMVFRIGINLGDVIVEGTDVFGDGVNVAARLESLAEPGGVLISASVHDQVQARTDLAFVDLGEQQLKNMPRPVRAFRLETESAATSDPLGAAKVAAPDLPSVAVLPFNNMSGDPEQEYFSDGMTEDLITELSRFRNLFVIARNSCFTFKGKAIDVKEAGRKLGARYIVEGSVRKAGNRVRVTAQLIETATGNHLWAERYDRDLEDIFAVQDEVVSAICGAIPGQIDRAAVEHSRRNSPGNLTAYDCELRGRWALGHWNEGVSVALDWFEKAVKADPGYALAHAGIAMACSYGVYVLGLAPEAALARARDHAQRATALDDRNPTVNAYAALAYYLGADHQLSRAHAERAVSLNPNDPFTLFILANVLTYAGELQQALDYFARSERLEPYAPDDQRLDCLCDCHYMLRNYAKVVEIHGIYQNVPAFLYLILAAAYAQMGEMQKAKIAVANYERLRPAGHDFKTMIKYQMRMCWRQEDRDHWLEGYRKAGIEV